MESAVVGKGRSENSGTDSESNSFDKNDDMSEDEMTVLGGKDAGIVSVDDSGDDEGQKRGKKRRKWVKIKVKVEGGSKSKSQVWDIFDKVTLPDPYEKGKMSLKAKCKYCKKHYSYIQGSTTSTLKRHMKNCEAYAKHLAKKLDQTLLNFAPSSACESGSGLPSITTPKENNHEQVKK